jgi:hypothetical protein
LETACSRVAGIANQHLIHYLLGLGKLPDGRERARKIQPPGIGIVQLKRLPLNCDGFQVVPGQQPQSGNFTQTRRNKNLAGLGYPICISGGYRRLLGGLLRAYWILLWLMRSLRVPRDKQQTRRQDTNEAANAGMMQELHRGVLFNDKRGRRTGAGRVKK